MVKIITKGKTTGREPLRHMPLLGLMQRTMSEHVLRLLDAIYQCCIQYHMNILDTFQWLQVIALSEIYLVKLRLIIIITFTKNCCLFYCDFDCCCYHCILLLFIISYTLFYQYRYTMMAMMIMAAEANNSGNNIKWLFVVVQWPSG